MDFLQLSPLRGKFEYILVNEQSRVLLHSLGTGFWEFSYQVT